jgi:hypothetical protein
MRRAGTGRAALVWSFAGGVALDDVAEPDAAGQFEAGRACRGSAPRPRVRRGRGRWRRPRPRVTLPHFAEGMPITATSPMRGVRAACEIDVASIRRPKHGIPRIARVPATTECRNRTSPSKASPPRPNAMSLPVLARSPVGVGRVAPWPGACSVVVAGSCCDLSGALDRRRPAVAAERAAWRAGRRRGGDQDGSGSHPVCLL